MSLSLNRPLSPKGTAIAIIGLTSAAVAYCFATKLAEGQPEHFGTALGWALTTIVPWLLCFELSKRLPPGAFKSQWPRLVTLLVGTALLSAFAEHLFDKLVFGPDVPSIVHLLVHRIPPAAVVLAAWLLSRVRARPRGAARSSDPGELPFVSVDVERISIAGNYLEMHSSAGIELVRMPMHLAENGLARHGFVRVHRSWMVRRTAVREYVAGKRFDELILASGAVVRVSALYRRIVRKRLT